jgi:hypothetical protein
VAVTVQDEPASPNVNVLPDTEQVPEALYDTAPDPEPPDDVNDTAAPYVPDVDVTVNALCEIRAIVKGAETYVTA